MFILKETKSKENYFHRCFFCRLQILQNNEVLFDTNWFQFLLLLQNID